MLDIKHIRDNLEAVQKSTESRNVKINFQEVIDLDEKHRKILTEVEQLKSERNKANEVIGSKKSKKEDAAQEIESVKTISQKIHEIDKEVGDIYCSLVKILLTIPNLIDKRVPISPDTSGNKVVKT